MYGTFEHIQQTANENLKALHCKTTEVSGITSKPSLSVNINFSNILARNCQQAGVKPEDIVPESVLRDTLDTLQEKMEGTPSAEGFDASNLYTAIMMATNNSVPGHDQMRGLSQTNRHVMHQRTP